MKIGPMKISISYEPEVDNVGQLEEFAATISFGLTLIIVAVIATVLGLIEYPEYFSGTTTFSVASTLKVGIALAILGTVGFTPAFYLWYQAKKEEISDSNED